ncbi:MAG: hypothetical protein ACXVKA_12210 [Acidimicrobiia bacterium]
MRSARWLLGALIVVLLGATAVPAAGAADPSTDQRVSRVLIISLPTLSWSDLADVRLPNLDRLLAQSAVAGMVTRTTGRTDLGEGYVTVGAGARSTAGGSLTDGLAFDAGETVGGQVARNIFEQRTGKSVRTGIVHLGIGPIIVANDSQRPDALVGALGDALARGGFRRAVVGNADTTDVNGLVAYSRELAASLMRTNGTVSHGNVSETLLQSDPSAPWGTRLDLDRTDAAFQRAWKPKSVVLVEGSDLVRARSYSRFATSNQATALFQGALERTDELIGRLLRHVDVSRDAVLLIGPQPKSATDTITLASVRAPWVKPGLLEAASTRRAGSVQLIDVGPTVLQLVGLPRPSQMTGRPYTYVASSKSPAEIRDGLVAFVNEAIFRDRVLNPVAIVFIVAQLLLVLGAIAAFMRPQARLRREIAHTSALTILAYVPMIYLARLFPFYSWPQAWYWVFVIGGAVALGLAYKGLGRGRSVDSIILALGAIVALLAADVMTGARLQLSSAFGYSPTVGIRLSGFGNIAFAALSASAVLLAGLLAHRIGGRRGVWIGIAVMALALIVDGVPFWGADVGGVLSMVPAFGITGWILLDSRRRPKLRTMATLGAATVVAVAIVAAIDLSRPADKQTHLGRLVQQVSDEGPSIFGNVIVDKIHQNLSTLTSSVWGLMLPIVAGILLVYLWLAQRQRIRDLFIRIGELRASAIGFLVLAVLGYALNDSGIVVPAMMLGIFAPVLVVLLTDRTTWDTLPEDPTGSPDEPDADAPVRELARSGKGSDC